MNFNPSVALLDACVLYPYTLRDLLMHLAVVDLYRPKWSDRIQKEWMINLLENKKCDYTREKLQRTINLMNEAFDLANVEESLFLNLIPTLKLKDPDDRHVLAAAIAAKADFLVTFNLKDFPSKIASSYGITPISPDDFIFEIASQHPKIVISALQNQSKSMKKWPKSPAQIIETIGKIGLRQTANFLLKII